MVKRDSEKMAEELALSDNRYLLVRPASGLHDGWEAVDVWKQEVRKRGEKDAMVEWCRDYASQGSTYDYVLVVTEPKRADEGDNDE